MKKSDLQQNTKYLVLMFTIIGLSFISSILTGSFDFNIFIIALFFLMGLAGILYINFAVFRIIVLYLFRAEENKEPLNTVRTESCCAPVEVKKENSVQAKP